MARSKWTRSTYVMVAEALNAEYRRAHTADAKVAIMNAACELADRFAADNDAFNRASFMDKVGEWR